VRGSHLLQLRAAEGGHHVALHLPPVGPEGPDGKIALEIPNGTLIPANAVVTIEDDVRALKEG
jgi:hypothetical protein